uniref:E3 ubiquitin-protein ligase n=1 Tax=Monodelphis domestica TaxID=13616 RepID=F6PUL4_MONDO
MATGGSAHGPPWRVLVRVSENCSGLEKKLEKYFQSSKKSGGGECKVKAGPSEGTFWVEFLESQAKERVMEKRDHIVELSTMSHVKVFLEANENPVVKNTLEMSQLSSQPQSLRKEFSDENHPDEGGAPISPKPFIQKIFLHVEAHFNSNLLSKELRKKMTNLCPNLKIERGRDGIEKVSGDFQDIEKIYEFLSENILSNDQKEDLPHSASRREIEQIIPNDWDSHITQSNPKHRTEEEPELITVPSDLYQYFKHVFADTLDEIEKEHKVHIKSTLAYPNVNLDFETSKPGNRKEAQEAFIRAFQTEIQNVTCKEVCFEDDKLALEAQRILTDKFKKLHLNAKGKFLILRGNLENILAAQDFIEKNSSHKQSVQIRVSRNMLKNGIEVDRVCLYLLQQELTKIEKKFDISVEFVNDPLSQKVLLVFKPKDNGLDLSVHAYKYFTGAFQMVLPQIVKKVVSLKPLDKERKKCVEKIFFDDLKTKHPHVGLEWNGRELTLAGLPRHIGEAMGYIENHFRIEDPAQQSQGSALSVGGNSNGELKSPLERNAADFKMALLPSKEVPSSGDKGKEEKEEEKECIICMSAIRHKEVLPKCKHEFCGPCIREAMTYRPVCPLCQTVYGIITGNQPDGKMTFNCSSTSLPGYSSCGTIEIFYEMPGGIQTEEHPNPGKFYSGTKRVAYLPDNEEGRQVLYLLKRAFDQKLIFTVGHSRTTGASNTITWNDIHHKTSRHGGPENFGYPDPDYLKRVKLELKAKGIE